MRRVQKASIESEQIYPALDLTATWMDVFEAAASPDEPKQRLVITELLPDAILKR